MKNYVPEFHCFFLPTALLPQDENWGGCVGASPRAKTGPDPHVNLGTATIAVQCCFGLG